MIYGMYRSATGVMTAQHRQSVIANNLANAETMGFKRDLSLTLQRRTAAQELPTLARYGERLHNKLGGGQLLAPTQTDFAPGVLEPTGSNLDAAINGKGFFVVQNAAGERLLTRNGNFMLDDTGTLILADGSNARVLNRELAPIRLDPLAPTEINSAGDIVQRGQPVARLALKDADTAQLTKVGQQLHRPPGEVAGLADAANSTVRGGSLERSNVDPALELTSLLESQRHLEANANMIRYQDQALARLVNDVGKIG